MAFLSDSAGSPVVDLARVTMMLGCGTPLYYVCEDKLRVFWLPGGFSPYYKQVFVHGLPATSVQQILSTVEVKPEKVEWFDGVLFHRWCVSS